jgi:ATP-dependent 26S proteasome regulatory subunit
LTGEFPETCTTIDRDAISFQNVDAVRDLKLRMISLLREPILIGTTADAFRRNKRQELLTSKIQNSLQTLVRMQGQRNVARGNVNTSSNRQLQSSSQTKLSFHDGSLLVHSPHHVAGKTALVAAIARQCCNVVHVLRPGPILAKFGIYADSAVECIIHDITLAASVKNQSIAIIIDDLDAFVPGTNSAILNGYTGDAAVPILSASHAYIRNLSVRLQYDKEVPFPTKTPLYNINGKDGCVLPVRICLIAIVTCPDDGYCLQSLCNNSSGLDGNIMTIFDTMVSGRFRLPDLTPTTRLRSFHSALYEEEVVLSDELVQQLPVIAASALWARGPAFKKIAKLVQSRNGVNGNVSLQLFTSILESFSKSEHSGSNVQFVLNSKESNGSGDIFHSIGGNADARLALVDALGLDTKRNARLAVFGMSRPAGILLYGPPGTGKTLIAKSVASLIQSKTSSIINMGGAFITVNSTDVAQSEVGSGEKMLVSAFDAARRNSPSVIFIDEFQALFTDRASGGSGRLSTTLFQCMDKISQWRQVEQTAKIDKTTTSTSTTDKFVIVLAATNTPWMIEKAFLRTGRFDRVVHVGLPEANDRISIFRLYISSMQVPSTFDMNAIDNVCTRLASVTVGFSGADIAALCRAAAVRCLLCKDTYVNENYFWEALEVAAMHL